jgi:hypothetical protein
LKTSPDCWAIYRELAHSPGRETDDAEILRATASRLSEQGFSVALKTPEEAAGGREDPPPHLFVMCERLPILDRLEKWEASGARIVNRPSGVRNTYRDRTIGCFERDAVSFPKSLLVPTSGDFDAVEAVFGDASVWVKRADVHSTREGDVCFATTAREASEPLRRLGGRGIDMAVVQAHVAGDLIKFYGVGVGSSIGGAGGDWFEWFYHRDQTLARHPFDARDLRLRAQRAASSLGLEIFGGDAIASADGRITLIDLNAWPSFALYREAASARIAAYLAARFRAEERVPG